MHGSSDSHWIEITPSEYAWEREALRYLRTKLPDGDPFRAWSNFEFIADDGSINEVDLLVVSLHCVYLVEIKSWRGVVSGDQSVWSRTVGGRTFPTDSPLLLANRKARKLASLLRAQPALADLRTPFVETVVFLSHAKCRLEGLARTGVYLSENHAASGEPNIVDVLSGAAGFDRRRARLQIDRPLARAFARAMEQAGIRPSQRQRRVSDYMLRRLLLETDTWQEWEAEHVSVPASKRRVRIYPLARVSSDAERAEQRAAAEREYLLLDGINHDGILRVELFTDADQGPALVFEHDPAAERLDHFLDRRGPNLTPETRRDMVRQLAETLQHAHARDFYHRALSPRHVLVMDPDAERPRLKIFDWQTGTHAAGGALMALGPASDDAEGVYLAPETSLGGYDPRDPRPLLIASRKLDLFSLGAVAYRLLTGAPPAATVDDLHARLGRSGGLKLSDELDGVPESLQLAVEVATDPDAARRPDSVAEFRQQLDEAERELTATREPRDDVQTVTPTPEAADDQLRVPEERPTERESGTRDSTRFDLWVGNEYYRALAKRWLIFHIVKAVLDNGGSPEEVASTMPPRKFKIFDGIVRAEQMIEEQRLRRYFSKDDEIFHVAGKTCILSNQWGTTRSYTTPGVAKKLAAIVPDLKCHWEPA